MEVSSRNLIDGRISLSFDTYMATSTGHRPPAFNSKDEEVPSDEDELYTLAVFTFR